MGVAAGGIPQTKSESEMTGVLSSRAIALSDREMKLILSSNRNKGELKLDYTYMPIADYKVEQELEVKRKGEIKNPADQMFKDGNYSQQGGPERAF